MKKLILFCLLFSSIIINAQCYQSLKFGGGHTVGLKSDGTLWGWGFAAWGQLTTSNFTEPNPVPITTIANVQNFYLGLQNTFVIKTDGTLWGTGSNDIGELGVNSTAIQFETFQQITSTNNWLKIAPSHFFTLALKTDGTIWAWGQDDTNQTGNPPATASQNTPIQVGTATDWIDVATNTSRTAFALKADGTIWGWGANSGNLLVPNSSLNAVSTPIQINGVAGFVKMSVGFGHILAQKADGTLWTWGTGPARGIGDGGPPIGSVPIQIGTDTWSYFTTGLNTSFGIKSNGTLWAWGFNTNGQLGLGTETDHSVPVQLGTDSNWATVQARKFATTMATKTDGTVWYWGRNYSGEFGNGQDYVAGYFTTPQLSPNVCVTSLSTPEFEKKDKVRMYPNPASNTVNLQYDLGVSNSTVEVYELSGRLLTQLALNSSEGTTQINVNTFSAGMYIVVVRNGNDILYQQKLIIK